MGNVWLTAQQQLQIHAAQTLFWGSMLGGLLAVHFSGWALFGQALLGGFAAYKTTVHPMRFYHVASERLTTEQSE